MVKCEYCNKKIENLFLEKIKGIYIRENKKLIAKCSECQKRDDQSN
ncbi:hypothetical protein J4440_01960 [Candidatus Woesearchaeota archaeon]|nr:hypothetical protein [Candidatus Woesearchaeota archaeon]